jgi:murein biosynthesis integral membrane protein MurJ
MAAVGSGLVLDVAIAATFGAGAATDAFFVAARLPLGLVAVVMIGANQALVPSISTWLERHGEEPTWRLVSILLSATLAGGLLLAGLSAILAGPLMALTAPGLTDARTAVAASLARVLFLVVPLVAGAEVLRALLNARYSFVIPAGMNVIMNGLAAGVVLGIGGTINVVAWAYVAGAAAQLVFMFVAARLRGFRYRPTLAVREPEIVATGRLMIRPLIGGAANPLARVGEQMFVSFLPSGALTILNYGYRLISAIGGTVLFRSVTIALVPRLTTATVRRDEEEIHSITRLGARVMLLVAIPLTAFMAVLAEPAALLVFRRQNFTRDAAVLLGVVLAVYSASLVGSALQRAMLAPFFARLDTRTPLRNTFYGVAANLLFLPVCVLPFGRHENAIIGVAIAYSLAQYVNLAHAWYRMRRDIGVRLRGIGPSALRLGGASVLSGAAMWGLSRALALTEPMHRGELLLKIAGVGAVGLVILAASLAVLGASEVRALIRIRRSPAAEIGAGEDVDR